MAHKNNKKLAPAQLRVLRQIGRAEDYGNYWWHSCSKTDLAIMRLSLIHISEPTRPY